MKKYRIIFIWALLCLAMTSCSDYLDKAPDDQLTMEMIFTDKVRTEDWLASVYSGVPNPMWGYMKEQGYNIMGDDITIPQDWSPFGWANVYAFTTGNWSPISTWGPYYWLELPKRIRTALILQREIRVIPEVGLTTEYVEQMKYESRFLVAYFYHLMIELYGPIPFSPGVIFPVDATADQLMTPQTPYDDIVDWIDAELLEVSKHLPAVYASNNDWGKATSIMCLAIRAKTLLEAASPLFNGNPDFANWKNSEGVNLFKPGYDANKWTRAAQAFKEMITAAEAAGYGLYYEYNDDGSIDPYMSCYNLQFKRWSDGNKEIVFGRADVDGGGGLNYWQQHHLPKGIGGNAAMGVTQELVDAFATANGIVPVLGYNADGSPILNPEAVTDGYNETGFSAMKEMRTTKWPGGGPAAEADLPNGRRPVTMNGTFNMYCNREPRFYVSVIYNNAWLGCDNRYVQFLQGGRDTDMTFDSPQNGYNVRKGVSLDCLPRDNKFAYQPGILYRMADAYLGYAEALNESMAAPNDEVYRYVNLIRERGGIPDLRPGMSKEEMRAAIQRERRVELNCEGVRIHDLRRWKLGEQYLNNKLYRMNHDGNKASTDPNDPQAFYKRIYYKARTFTKKMYLWPVPQAQVDINPNLVQAPGYAETSNP